LAVRWGEAEMKSSPITSRQHCDGQGTVFNFACYDYFI